MHCPHFLQNVDFSLALLMQKSRNTTYTCVKFLHYDQAGHKIKLMLSLYSEVLHIHGQYLLHECPEKKKCFKHKLTNIRQMNKQK